MNSRLFYIFAIVFVVLLGFAACKNSDEVNNPKQVSEPTMEQMYDDISQVLSSTTFNEQEMQRFDELFGDMEMTTENMEAVMNTPDMVEFIMNTGVYKGMQEVVAKYITTAGDDDIDMTVLGAIDEDMAASDYVSKRTLSGWSSRGMSKGEQVVVGMFSAFKNSVHAATIGNQVLIRDKNGDEMLLRMPLLYDDEAVKGDKIALYEINVADMSDLIEEDIASLAKQSLTRRFVDVEEYEKMAEAKDYLKGSKPCRLIEEKGNATIGFANCLRTYRDDLMTVETNFQICMACVSVGAVYSMPVLGPVGAIGAYAGGAVGCAIAAEVGKRKAKKDFDNCVSRL